VSSKLDMLKCIRTELKARHAKVDPSCELQARHAKYIQTEGDITRPESEGKTTTIRSETQTPSSEQLKAKQ